MWNGWRNRSERNAKVREAKGSVTVMKEHGGRPGRAPSLACHLWGNQVKTPGFWRPRPRVILC